MTPKRTTPELDLEPDVATVSPDATDPRQPDDEAGASTQDGLQEGDGERRTSYTVLASVDPELLPEVMADVEVWQVIGAAVEARSDLKAIAAAVGDDNYPEGTAFVAVPRWVPRRSQTQTVTRRLWS